MSDPVLADARNAALVCRGIIKSFDDTVAVDGVDLEVVRGSLLSLLGPSGCGKTTMLRLIAGLTRPDRGSIVINGKLVNDANTWTPAERRRVGLVFQEYALFPHLTVARNVAFGLADRPRRQRRARVEEVLALVGLAGHAGRLPSELSGGQQQRVALARALAPSPDIVLLDEPFSNLDAAMRTTVREDIRAILREAETTAIFVTHDQEEALSLTDQVAVMNDGRIHQLADPHTLYTQPATRFVAQFVGESDIIPGTRAGEFLVDTPIGRLATTAPVQAATVDVMIRPEALRLRANADGIARVVGISYFGHDQLVHMQFDDGQVIRARRGPRLDLQRDDRIDVTLDGSVITFDRAGIDRVQPNDPPVHEFGVANQQPSLTSLPA